MYEQRSSRGKHACGSFLFIWDYLVTDLIGYLAWAFAASNEAIQNISILIGIDKCRRWNRT